MDVIFLGGGLDEHGVVIEVKVPRYICMGGWKDSK